MRVALLGIEALQTKRMQVLRLYYGLPFFPESEGLNMSNKEMDFSAYKKALAHWAAKNRFLVVKYKKILDESLDSTKCTLSFRDKLCDFMELLNKPADFYITGSEWREASR